MLFVEFGELIEVVQVGTGPCRRSSVINIAIDCMVDCSKTNIPPSTEFSSCRRVRKWNRYESGQLSFDLQESAQSLVQGA